MIPSKIYDKRDDFDDDTVNFLSLDGDVPSSTAYGAELSQTKRFVRVLCHVTDLNARNDILTAKLLQQGYWYHELRKSVLKVYRRHKFKVGLNKISKDTSETGRIKTQSLSQTSKGKMNKHTM